MKKTIGLMVLVALVLAACGQAVPDHSADIAAAEAIAKKFTEASSTKNADQYIALLSTDYNFMDYGVNDGPINYSEMKLTAPTLFQIPNFQLKISSTIVSADGRFITVLSMYTFSSKNGQPATVPAVGILEIRDGKITSETWYYDGSWF